MAAALLITTSESTFRLFAFRFDFLLFVFVHFFDSRILPAFLPALSRHRPSSHRCAVFNSPSRGQFCRATRRSLVQTDACDPPSPQADRGDRFNPTSASPNLRQNPHSARGPAPAYVPRFRALALFGRRPPQRVEGFVMPASKNLHSNGHRQTRRKRLREHRSRAAATLLQIWPPFSCTWRLACRLLSSRAILRPEAD
jgi:hypothetical protein